jgi:RES domain-containing protein
VSLLTLWRICPATYAADVFGGKGGLFFPARWHNKGRPIVYTAESRALAALEILANTQDRSALHTQSWLITRAEVTAALVETPSRFPDDWRSQPPPASSRAFGDAWLASLGAPVLRVPSAVILGEFNYLLNPLHPDFKKIQLHAPQPFAFDARF